MELNQLPNNTTARKLVEKLAAIDELAKPMIEPRTHAQDVLDKCRLLFPETPESKHAKSQARKVEDNERRKLLIRRHNENLKMLAMNRASVKARKDRSPKTVGGSN